jgi:asparagine synthetase B (glutamine-hydrolysing)
MKEPVRLLGELDPSFAWDGSRLYRRPDFLPEREPPGTLWGAAASAETDGSGTWRLLRDSLGINKLFWAKDEEGTILVAARPYLLVEAGCSFAKIRALPPGAVVDLLPGGVAEQCSLAPDLRPTPQSPPGIRIENIAEGIRSKLDRYLSTLAADYPKAEVFVCLSGGLDSTGIMVLVREHFPDAVAVSFDLWRPGGGKSEDRQMSERLARDLSLPLLKVEATEEMLFEMLDTVLLEGIDWRDFNVHAGLVNAVLAEKIGEAATDRPTLVFTGDLANEFLADYQPEQHGGSTYYRLPRLSVTALRNYLVRGLDTSHREVGVFAAWGLPVVQPYAVALEEYMMLGEKFLSSENSKQLLCREIFQSLIPEYVLSRPKARAQVGSSNGGGSVLAACVDGGFDSSWLEQRFATLHGVEDLRALNRFIRAGRYYATLPYHNDEKGKIVHA